MLILRLRFYLSLLALPSISLSCLSGKVVDEVDATKENVQEVVQLRETLSKERRAWRQQKELMEGQLRLDKLALEQLEAQLAESRPLLDSLLTESSRFEIDVAEYSRLIAFWVEKLGLLKQKLAGLVGRLPPGLKATVDSKFRDLNSIDITSDKTGMKRAFDLSLEIISDANDYNLKIHSSSELHERPDGRQGDFKVVLLGLAGGYYYSTEAGLAGRIVWNGSQWSWVEDNALLDDLLGLGDVISGKEPPRFVELPFELNRRQGQ